MSDPNNYGTFTVLKTADGQPLQYVHALTPEREIEIRKAAHKNGAEMLRALHSISSES